MILEVIDLYIILKTNDKINFSSDQTDVHFSGFACEEESSLLTSKTESILSALYDKGDHETNRIEALFLVLNWMCFPFFYDPIA